MLDAHPEFRLDERDKRLLLHTAREAIQASLSGKAPLFPPPTPRLLERCGAFVTLHRRGALRGCLGNVQSSKPLVETVREMAVASAFCDPRFPPLCRAELPEIALEISVLSPLCRIQDAEEIEVGKHGIMIRLGCQSGLLLPQVAEKYRWDRLTFLDQTCRKAGLPPGSWNRPEAIIEIFSAQVFHEV